MYHLIPPLRKRNKYGILYTRPPEIEKLIVKSLDLPFDEFVDRAGITDRRNPDYLRSEVLVHRIRATRYDNSDFKFTLLYPLLSKRILRTCPSAKKRIAGKVGEIGSTMDVREFVLERFVMLILTDRENYAEGLDIFEARFDRAVMLLRYDALRKVSRRDNPLIPLEYEESNDIPNDVEVSRARFNPISMTSEEDLTYRLQIRRAIDSLPDIERRVIDMFAAGLPIESKDSDKPSIARELSCTPKTVRNRRDRAIRRIQERLGLEVCNAD